MSFIQQQRRIAIYKGAAFMVVIFVLPVLAGVVTQ